MRAWTRPEIPTLPGAGTPPTIFDTASQQFVEAKPVDVARLYVCGITPYDATHIGHAATYLAFDTLQRVWIDAGFRVHYAQNVTDIDDPLLARAAETHVDWRQLADQQVELFRTDMAALSLIPPDNYVAVTEEIDSIGRAVSQLLDAGMAYRVPTEGAVGDDVYFDNAAAEKKSPWTLGGESHLDNETMRTLFAERGGDPERPGKRDPLDSLLWRAARKGEPSWPSAVGEGRPGWHIECSVIALKHLGRDFTVQGGGADLVFPHHEFSAGHAAALSGHPLAKLYSHTGLVAYQGAKMSKSLGNLVLVSGLRESGVDPRVIRLAILAHHYRSDWEWTDAALNAAQERLEKWSALRSHDQEQGSSPLSSDDVLSAIRGSLAGDLDTAAALNEVDRAAKFGVDNPQLVINAVDALLGVRL